MNIGEEGEAFIAEPLPEPDVTERTIEVEPEKVPVPVRRRERERERETVPA